ncbi:MAG: amidohydrolase family protein [Edaphobacter sp.]|uniref:amidohydrolase family protein n=1 Tax=Edaphobacter sp. TaxID=1934404 RepID=UPI00238EBE52|nr:amidohydrolase family protein [Edaphobacter sp.]MDE1177045.1 amidohydrolase family protein [Edaphobacter sp.]
MRASLAMLAVSCAVAGASAQTSEQGRFILHKFARTNGEETYSITRSGNGFKLTSDFLFTDRGTKVPLKTVFTATGELEPLTLSLDGQSSRMSGLKDSMEYHADAQSITLVRDGKTQQLPAPKGTFLIDGYSPVTMQQMLMRYWLRHGKPASIPTPAGSVTITPAGTLSVAANGQQHALQGYVINGLIWGGETLWMDERQDLVALISTDAEFDHFEAIRDEYEGALGTFIQNAANDNLAALAKLAASAKQPVARNLVIQNVTLIDGTGAAPVKDATVFVEDGKIASIVTAPKPEIPAGATVIDGTGKYLIPGLWDMHAHYEQVEWGPIYLAAGVTTARDCGNEFDFITTVRNTLAAGKGIGPEILIAGVVDGNGPMSLGAVTADTPEQAREVVRRYKAAGAMQIKIYSSLKPDLVPVIAEEAHKLGMTVTGHVPNGMTTEQAVMGGYDQINHIQYPVRDLLHLERGKEIPPADFSTPDAQRQIALYKQHHTVFDDTISLYENFYHPSSVAYATLEPGVLKVAPQLAEALASPGVPADRAVMSMAMFHDMMATVRELHKDGLAIVAGTDQNIPGYSLHRELELYIEAGFTPMEALQAATSVPARVMGLDKSGGND